MIWADTFESRSIYWLQKHLIPHITLNSSSSYKCFKWQQAIVTNRKPKLVTKSCFLFRFGNHYMLSPAHICHLWPTKAEDVMSNTLSNLMRLMIHLTKSLLKWECTTFILYRFWLERTYLENWRIKRSYFRRVLGFNFLSYLNLPFHSLF